MIAKEILDQRIVAAKPEELIKEAAIRFLGHNLGHIPVVESEHLVGLLSIETMLEDGLLEKECALCTFAHHHSSNPSKCPPF